MSARRFIVNALRFGIAAGLLAFLVYRLDLDGLAHAASGAAERWPWVVAALLLTYFGLHSGVMRWHRILAAQGIVVPFAEIFRFFFIGQFFNAFMLGACGGDVARAYFVSKAARKTRAEAISTVFVDRAIGLFVTVVFACVMILLHLHLFRGYPLNRNAGLLMFAFLAASVVGLATLFSRNLFEQWGFFRRIERDTRLGPLIRRTYEAFYLYRGKPRVLASAVFYSLLNLIFLTLACACFGSSLGVAQPMSVYFVLFPIITVVAAIPLTPGSLGVREGLFVAMFATVGTPDETAMLLSLMVYADGVLWSLFGGAIFMARPAETRHELRSGIAGDERP